MDGTITIQQIQDWTRTAGRIALRYFHNVYEGLVGAANAEVFARLRQCITTR